MYALTNCRHISEWFPGTLTFPCPWAGQSRHSPTLPSDTDTHCKTITAVYGAAAGITMNERRGPGIVFDICFYFVYVLANLLEKRITILVNVPAVSKRFSIIETSV